jgi:hypothetical protein
MSKNITIPLTLFSKITNLLDNMDISDIPPYLRPDYSDILFAMMKKQQSMELREAYAKIITADSDVDRHDARMQYLLLKRDKYEL